MSQRGGWLLEWHPLGLLIGLVLGGQARAGAGARLCLQRFPLFAGHPVQGLEITE